MECPAERLGCAAGWTSNPIGPISASLLPGATLREMSVRVQKVNFENGFSSARQPVSVGGKCFPSVSTTSACFATRRRYTGLGAENSDQALSRRVELATMRNESRPDSSRGVIGRRGSHSIDLYYAPIRCSADWGCLYEHDSLAAFHCCGG